jgi:hypothetical protein
MAARGAEHENRRGVGGGERAFSRTPTDLPKSVSVIEER